MHTATDPFSSRVSPFPRDLRGNSAAGCGAGKIYPVDPEAVANLKAILANEPERIRPLLRDEKVTVVGQPRKKATETAVPASQRDAKGVTQMDQTEETAVYPTAKAGELYPPEVISAARREMAKENPRARRLANVITADVVAVWLGWLDEGKAIDWIRQNNELMPLSFETVTRYIDKYRAGVERQEINTKHKKPETSVPEPEPVPVAAETAVSEPDPQPEQPTEEAQTAVAYVPEKPENLPAFLDRDYAPRRAASPGIALGDLVRLLDNEKVKVKGSLSLNVEIEFGD